MIPSVSQQLKLLALNWTTSRRYVLVCACAHMKYNSERAANKMQTYETCHAVKSNIQYCGQVASSCQKYEKARERRDHAICSSSFPFDKGALGQILREIWFG